MSGVIAETGDGMSPIVFAVIAMALTALFFGGCMGA